MKTKRIAQFTLLILPPVFYLGFVFGDRYGCWDRLRGLDLVKAIASKYEKSYSLDACPQIRPGDKEWKPMLHLIYRYSRADFPQDRQPKVLARFQAVASYKEEIGLGKLAEWTAPSTPFALIYVDWPGQEVPLTDFRVIGTIGDLRTWITQSEDDLRFLVQDVFLTVFGVILAVFVWTLEGKSEKPNG